VDLRGDAGRRAAGNRAMSEQSREDNAAKYRRKVGGLTGKTKLEQKFLASVSFIAFYYRN